MSRIDEDSSLSGSVASPSPNSPAAETSTVVSGEILDGRAVDQRLQLTGFLSHHATPDLADVAYLHGLAADVIDYTDAAQASATRVKYHVGWSDFEAFCTRFRLPALPAGVEVAALYLASLVREGVAMSTFDSRVAAIRDKHLDAGYSNPTEDPRIKQLRKGIRRTHGTAAYGKDVLTPQLLVAMLATMQPGPQPAEHAHSRVRRAWLIQRRDRCILTLAFFAALRRSEAVALDVNDLELVEQGLRVTIRKAKTDQTGKGRVVDLPYAPVELAYLCPVRNTLAWIDAAGLRCFLHRTGQGRNAPDVPPLLTATTPSGSLRTSRLNDQEVKRVVKAAAEGAGEPEEVIAALAAHSTRSGFATLADAAGVAQSVIGRVLGHATGTTARYIRPAFDGAAQRAVYGYMIDTLSLAAA